MVLANNKGASIPNNEKKNVKGEKRKVGGRKKGHSILLLVVLSPMDIST